MKPLIKVPFTYGLIAGGLAFVLALGLYYLDRHPFLIPLQFDPRILLFVIFILFSLKELRDNYRGGVLYFSEGFLCSGLFLLFFSITSSLLIGLLAWLDNEFVSSFIKLFREQVSKFSEDEVKQLGKENIERNLAALSSTNAFWMAFNYFKQSFLLGMPISIILSIILRKQPKT